MFDEIGGFNSPRKVEPVSPISKTPTHPEQRVSSDIPEPSPESPTEPKEEVTSDESSAEPTTDQSYPTYDKTGKLVENTPPKQYPPL